MLYVPHESEDDLLAKIHRAKSGGPETWREFVDQIHHVKSQVMEYLEDTEEARLMASEMMVNNSVTGEYMDPEGEQEAKLYKLVRSDLRLWEQIISNYPGKSQQS